MAGLYLHIPFCRHKCPYCDFFSVEADNNQLTHYADLLTTHLDWAARQGWEEPLETIYFGGGTPSLLEHTAVKSILSSIYKNFEVAKNAEITLEVNPGTVTPESFAGYRNAGINRLSLGLQSHDDKQLTRLGRIHNANEGIDAVRWARSAGFDKLSLDLIFALPGQTLSELSDELDSYLELEPEHLSCYGLTAEPHTELHHEVTSGKTLLPDEDLYAESFLLIHDRLQAAGFEHYEIANYARPGARCRHNMGYWQRQPYLGIGAGAHSFMSSEWGSRWQVPAVLDDYRTRLTSGLEPMTCLEAFDKKSALHETIYLALRTRDGVSETAIQELFDVRFSQHFAEAIEASTPWLSNEGDRWLFSPRGWLLFDRLILPFL